MSLLLALALAAADNPAAMAVVPDCGAHKFEAPITTTVDGQTKQSKVKICGHVGQTNAQWADTLKDARAKVVGNLKMPGSIKDQIVPALDIEIARLADVKEASAPPATVLTPLPSATAVLTPPASAPEPTQPLAEYSALPPLPAPVPVAIATAKPAPPPLPAPRLTLRCMATDATSAEGPCDDLQRDMLVTVRADEDIARGTSLRFLRRGDNRAEVGLAALRRGQTQRFPLPPRVCQGVGGSRVEIQVVRAVGSSSEVVDTRGPFDLRC